MPLEAAPLFTLWGVNPAVGAKLTIANWELYPRVFDSIFDSSEPLVRSNFIMSTLFVGNLAWSTTEETLTEFLSAILVPCEMAALADGLLWRWDLPMRAVSLQRIAPFIVSYPSLLVICCNPTCQRPSHLRSSSSFGQADPNLLCLPQACQFSHP